MYVIASSINQKPLQSFFNHKHSNTMMEKEGNMDIFHLGPSLSQKEKINRHIKNIENKYQNVTLLFNKSTISFFISLIFAFALMQLLIDMLTILRITY